MVTKTPQNSPATLPTKAIHPRQTRVALKSSLRKESVELENAAVIKKARANVARGNAGPIRETQWRAR